jgi:hypothetical protein
MDSNHVHLCGRISTINFAKSKKDKEYATIGIGINRFDPIKKKQVTVWLRIGVFLDHHVTYLHDTNAAVGDRIYVCGSIYNIKTNGYTQLSVAVQDLMIGRDKGEGIEDINIDEIEEEDDEF